MERRLTVQLRDDLAEQPDAQAARSQQRPSELVRLALRQYLARQSDQRPIDLVRDLLGQVDSGIPDLAERHHDYIVQRLRDAR